MAVVVLSSVGALELLFILMNITGLAWVAVNGLPADWCNPSNMTHLRCPSATEMRPSLLGDIAPFLIALSILGMGTVLAVLSFRGPKTVSRRPRRIALSVSAIASPVLVWVWIFH